MTQTAINNMSLEDVIKAVLEVLRPEEIESPENLVPETSVKSYRMLEDYPDILQAKHVKAILGFSDSKTYEVLNCEKCPSITAGKRKVVRKEAFIEYLKSCDGQDLID
jgi:predicted DNA-binding transcriptional regulator AlpA